MLFIKDNLITFLVSEFCFSEETDILRRIKPKETKMVDMHNINHFCFLRFNSTQNI